MMSDPFTVTQVLQGCLLSLIPFSLYLKDVHEILPADDVVLLSDTPKRLLDMLNSLHKY